MKKVVRSVWICALSGLAFLGACCTQNGLTRRERKQLLKEREQIEMQLSKYEDDRIDTPFIDEYMDRRNKKYALENKLDSINFCLGDNIDLDRNVRRRQILQRIDSLNYLVETYTPPLYYGPPSDLKDNDDLIEEKVIVESDIERWERQLKEAQRELDEFDISRLPDAEVLYGSPYEIRIK